MKTKIISFLTTVLLSLSAFTMKAEEIIVDIPLQKTTTDVGDSRNLFPQPIQCYFLGNANHILTTFNVDLGDVYIEVMNITTGETENVSFDSGYIPQISLPISGNEGLHIVTIVTESGNVYEGSFTI